MSLKQQLVSSWASDGLDVEKLHTKVVNIDIDNIICIAITIIVIVIPKTRG